MARPQTKKDLVEQSEQKYQKLKELLVSLTPEELATAFDFSSKPNLKEKHWQRDQNVRDVLIHLYEWHQLLLTWVKANQTGEEQPFIPAPYNWRTYGQLNATFFEKHQKTSLEEAISLLDNSHQEVMAMINHYQNDDLFAKDALPWTKGSTLGSYCVSATSSHYEWAAKKLRLHKKRLNKKRQ